MPIEATVYVVDDDDAARDSLAFLLKSAKLPVETFESGDAFLAKLPKGGGGCVITDIRMPGINGIELLKRLRTEPNPPSIIVITGHGDVPLAVEAMKQGAADFLEKPFDDEEMLAAIRAALARRNAHGRQDAERSEVHEKLATLSSRERQVLDGLVAGLPNKSIAYDLKISPRTVEIYRANTMTKMGARSLSELVRMALIAGLTSPADNSTGR
jgi:two-component system, LuxR family, response regulator FixJ